MDHSNKGNRHILQHPIPFITTPDVAGSPNSVHSEPLLSIQTDLAPQSGYLQPMASDIPDLYYEFDQCDTGSSTTPPSAASSNLMLTPSYDWDRPLPVIGSPSTGRQKQLTGYFIDPWSFCPEDPFNMASSPYTPCDGGYISTQFPYEPSCHEYLDDLYWDKERHTPEYSPSYLPSTDYSSSTQPSHYDTHSQSISLHPASATYDTQHSKHLIPASPSLSASTSYCSASTSTVSPSMLILSENTAPSSSAPTTTPLSAISQPSPSQLHHPRPSRRIPIISLAELASASDEVLQKRVPKTLPKSPLQALSPLPIDGRGFASAVAPSRRIYPPQPGMTVIACSCGCMESYTM